MTAPSVVATQTYFTNVSSTTSHVITLPTGHAAGDLCIILFVNDSTSTPTPPAGWNILRPYDWPTAPSPRLQPGSCTGFVMYRFLDGSEGSTITITTSAGQEASGLAWLIRGHDPDYPPELATVLYSSGTTSPNPPAYLPAGWEALDTLWLAAVGADTGTATITGTPTSYSNAIGVNGNTSGSVAARGAERQLNNGTSAEDPSAYTLSVSNNAFAVTVAIRPALDVDPDPVPFVESQVHGDGPSASSQSVVLPPDRAIGDRVIFVLAWDGIGANTITLPAGWTRIGSDISVSSGAIVLTTFYRDMDGSEANTITITTGIVRGIAYVGLRISNYDTATAPERATATGTSTSADPPSISPSWGTSQTTLYIAGAVSDSTGPGAGLSGTLSGYNKLAGVPSPDSQGASVRVMTKQDVSTSENPPAYTVSASVAWAAATIAVAGQFGAHEFFHHAWVD